MSIASFAMTALMSTGRVRALGHHATQFSPDHRFVAMTVHGEADCSYLCVFKVGKPLNHLQVATLSRQAADNALNPSLPMPKGNILNVMDVDSFLWIPGRAHTLVYGESGIYGDGNVNLVEVGKRSRSIASPRESEAQIFVKFYDPRSNRLTYDVRIDVRNKWTTKRRSVHVTLR